MGKVTFKCKGFLPNGDPCDKKVSARMHTGIATIISEEVKQVVVDIEGLKIDRMKDNAIPDLPSDWEFSLKCSRGHDEEYYYDERE